ncbi:PAS domain-containing sensor histidine kinase [Mucilaginibacter panaciglaebae]|uniref:histidine kinase n=1 Tax=Mucilaginibacter panaciglaebae TaxID=502331 RepID=A0ABP7WA52_9SPHI
MEVVNDDLLKQLGEVAEQGYFVYNLATKCVVYCGNAFNNILGLSPDEVEQQPQVLRQAVHPDDLAYLNERFGALLASRQIKTEFRVLVNERLKYIELNAYITGADNSLVIGYISDVTGVKNNMFYAEKINARKNAMLAVIAHDLKEPVAIINLMASAIRNDPTVANNNVLMSHIKIIQDLCDQNISLISDLMQKEFLESPEISLRKERSELVNAVTDIVRQYQNSENVLERQFRFTANAERIYATLDSLKIAQSINNLIANAIKFTPAGSLIEVRLEDMNDVIQISVGDNGIGIPAELQPYLFERRTRAHRLGLKGEPGAGIGLSIIRLLVELHGGRAWMESQEGVGSTFYIELPKIYEHDK